MSKKIRSYFQCNNCGVTLQSWVGKCPQCDEWNSIQEQTPISKDLKNGRELTVTKAADILKKHEEPRLKTTIKDINTVLGGGVVPGSVILLAGQPGIGKSTLLMQLSDSLANNYDVLYISGEESVNQVSLRASRLGSMGKLLTLSSSNSTNDIAATISSGKFKLVIVDSIQTISCEDVSSAPGSVSQITNSTYLLTSAAKKSSTALIIVGHVTKEGSIAGPKLLEHMVDVVLQLDGDRYGGLKILRSIKNRYGSTEESAIFEMGDQGMTPVSNPSAALLKERQITDGSIVLATIEGNRPILVEVQALVNQTSYGYPKRTASGFDNNRLNLLIAVMEKRTKLTLSDKDVFINVVGGLKLQDPAADLAVCMAIGSAAKGLVLKQDAVVFGEVGLSGEIRHVSFIEKRLLETSKMGFKCAIGPRTTKNKLHLETVNNIKDALNNFLKTTNN